MGIKGKKVLVTAGPTWVAIDKVRVISNIASAKTGIILAKKMAALGAKVTLLLGPIGEARLDKRVNEKRYSFFDELDSLLKRELSLKTYDAVIHSAAVSDYRPKNIFCGKVKSGKDNLNLFLKPTSKIVDKLKKYSPGIFLVMFKLEFGALGDKLINSARRAMQRAAADLCVVNTFSEGKYKALIINKNKVLDKVYSKEKLAGKLLKIISL
ncbi:MAG: phosphopantothenoylcysteine decarboxylase [Candidatus Omnitrophica bacterium]|nr:phosphopantothenoylcysteine decarboxylase [Candidatus Omnitrophota bacterium]